MRRRGPRHAALGGLLVLGCAAARPPVEPERTSPSRSRVRVSEVATIGPYLDATLSSPRLALRFFFPRSADCLAMIRPGAELRYLRVGSLGTAVDGEKRRCEPIGVASLREWRDREPRRRPSHLAPRVQVEFHTIFEGEDLVLVRGRFPLAHEIRWPAAMDTVAVLPAGPACDEALRSGKATMEYRATGPDPFLLLGEEGGCRVLGFAGPLEPD